MDSESGATMTDRWPSQGLVVETHGVTATV